MATPHTIADVARHFFAGYHAFVACDDSDLAKTMVETLTRETGDRPVDVIDGSKYDDLSNFANDVVRAGQRLRDAIGLAPTPARETLHAYLSDLQTGFAQMEQQGFLLFMRMDRIVELQRTFEIEAPFREAMQFHNNVAILWQLSSANLQVICGNDRPFYCSHRRFIL